MSNASLNSDTYSLSDQTFRSLASITPPSHKVNVRNTRSAFSLGESFENLFALFLVVACATSVLFSIVWGVRSLMSFLLDSQNLNALSNLL